MITLAAESSTYRGSVAVLDDARVLADADVAMKSADEERLMPAVAGALASARLRPADVDRFVCGAGPGSFTSLRVAASIAKGMATALGRPLYAVSSLALIAADDELSPGYYLAAIDALRGEHYVALFERCADGRVVDMHPARLVPTNAVASIARDQGAVVAGPSEGLDRRVVTPRARSVARLIDQVVVAGPVHLGDWEPSYGRLAEAQVKWEAAHGRPLRASS